MSCRELRFKINRGSLRKRPRGLGMAEPPPPVLNIQDVCSSPLFPNSPASESESKQGNSEDLFGDYNNSVEDSPYLSKPNGEEENERQQAANEKFTSLLSPKRNVPKQSDADSLPHSILEQLGEQSIEDLPFSQLEFMEPFQVIPKGSKLQHGIRTTPPSQRSEKAAEIEQKMYKQGATKTGIRARRSIAELLKKAMVANAGKTAGVSRSAAMKKAVVCREISAAMQAMETISAEMPDLGPFFGLPRKVENLMYKLRRIEGLYDWQKTCLNLDCIQQRKNLIYSLPTSGGKTLVAEILMLRELLCRKNDCLLILPYISLVQEKVRGLVTFGLELDFLVEEYAGSKGRFPPVKRKHKTSLFIATIEKAHSLVNSLIETNRIHKLGLVVVDELHMLGDVNRGAVIEMTLSKIQFVSKTTQIIGMSATLGNMKDLQMFLNAEIYTNDFRPVQLVEYVKICKAIYEIDANQENCLGKCRLLHPNYSKQMERSDPDHIVALVTEIIPTNSCLVFCPTKINCENVALMICQRLKRRVKPILQLHERLHVSSLLSHRDFLEHRKEEKADLIKNLEHIMGDGSVCPVLRKAVCYGVAYHHSGLSSEEKQLVEEAYSSGVLCLLTCTSTLAAGINLPARRVIIRSPYVGQNLLTRSRYKQMVGRAGRAGIDSAGESILLLNDRDKHMVQELACAPIETCRSRLLEENGKGIQSLILSLVGLNMTRSLRQIHDFMCRTLLFVQQQQLCKDGGLEEIVEHYVLELKEKKLITEVNSILEITRLGRATFKGCLDMMFCDRLYNDLSKGLNGLYLNRFLHLAYLVTPYHLVFQCKPDWTNFLRQYISLSTQEQKIVTEIGVSESLLARKAAGQRLAKEMDVMVVNRMYLALIVLSSLNGISLWEVSERFMLTRGFVQTLLSSASVFCSCVLHFIEDLEEFWPYKVLLPELLRRLTYCTKTELIPLMEIPGLTESRAKQLYDAGYKKPAHVVNSTPAILCKTIPNLFIRQANLLVASAKMLLEEKAAALQEAVDDLLTVPEDLPHFEP